MTPKERNLDRQLRETQASLPRLQLEALQANTAKDQAEATLRNTLADFQAYVVDVSDGVVANDINVIKSKTNDRRDRFDLSPL
jgi:hypothetical protein